MKKENLRDNMTNEELVLNMLAELSTTSITRTENPATLEENMDVAARGGKVARNAREDLERQLGRPVISSERASDHLQPIEDTPTQELSFEDTDKDK